MWGRGWMRDFAVGVMDAAQRTIVGRGMGWVMACGLMDLTGALAGAVCAPLTILYRPLPQFRRGPRTRGPRVRNRTRLLTNTVGTCGGKEVLEGVYSMRGAIESRWLGLTRRRWSR
jgi:hypothetical protein